ncbi:hypothetical protein QC763_115325 [Podospora pseudopauciseta]|uniref:Uncharacterized protein n=1 Tax=Podospora pseudopauciseta TaxID=2093780 RepID=A0ABR0I0C2_9PEZI|nr:hypothetical protein QC763_115325 [Podospora pseudopauciseta]
MIPCRYYACRLLVMHMHCWEIIDASRLLRTDWRNTLIVEIIQMTQDTKIGVHDGSTVVSASAPNGYSPIKVRHGPYPWANYSAAVGIGVARCRQSHPQKPSWSNLPSRPLPKNLEITQCSTTAPALATSSLAMLCQPWGPIGLAESSQREAEGRTRFLSLSRTWKLQRAQPQRREGARCQEKLHTSLPNVIAFGWCVARGHSCFFRRPPAAAASLACD